MFDLEISIFRAKSYPTWRILKLSDRWKNCFLVFFLPSQVIVLDYILLGMDGFGSREALPDSTQVLQVIRMIRASAAMNKFSPLSLFFQCKLLQEVDYSMEHQDLYRFLYGFLPGVVFFTWKFGWKNVISQSQPARRCEKHVAAGLRGDR